MEMNYIMELLQEKLIRLARESEEELREIGLGDKLKKKRTYTINYRAKCRFGQCCKKKDINISSWLLEVGTDEDITMEVAITYSQATNDVVDVDHPSTLYGVLRDASDDTLVKEYLGSHRDSFVKQPSKKSISLVCK